MNKQEFILAYVLARAGALDSDMDATGAAKQAEKAWEYASQFAPKPSVVRPSVEKQQKEMLPQLDAFSDGGRM